ncbi:MAG TPA: AtzE family amidohydrolase [Casimicrobiaceae bacterium]|nr:AtzE family amidohydrolase [Casimicrobiaceae bacterium]
MTATFPAPALAIAAAVQRGATTAADIALAALDAIARVDPALRSFTAVTADRALAEARAIDARRAAGAPLPPLAGVPYAVKNLFDVAGLTTLAGSKVNAANPPAGVDATLVARMKAAGAILVGALNMDEFAYGFTTENSHYGVTRNPHDTARIAGGSSGGSGAAVAARLVPLALGSDTNGSIRVPSSLCGVWGLKPTFGRLSRRGVFPFVSSLDHLGPIAATLPDLAICYDALQGPDIDDDGCAQRPVEPATQVLARGAEDLRIARLGGYFDNHLTPVAAAAVDTVCAALGVTHTVDLGDAAAVGRAAAFVVSAAEGGALHLPTLRTRRHDMEPLSRDRFVAGAILPAAWYVKAQRARTWYRNRMRAVFADADVLIAAATPCPATPIGAEWLDLGGARLPLRPSLGLLTQPISCIGLPVIAAPVANAGTLPIGVQIIAAPWREDLCFRVAAALAARGIADAPLAALHA